MKNFFLGLILKNRRFAPKRIPIPFVHFQQPYFFNFSANYPCVFVSHANLIFFTSIRSLSHVAFPLRIITFTLFIRPSLIVKTDRHAVTHEFISAFIIAIFFPFQHEPSPARASLKFIAQKPEEIKKGDRDERNFAYER